MQSFYAEGHGEPHRPQSKRGLMWSADDFVEDETQV